MRLSVPVGRDEITIVWAPSDTKNHGGVFFGKLHGFLGLDIENPYVHAHRRQVAAVGTEGQIVNDAAGIQLVKALTAARVPKDNFAIPSSSGEQPSVRSERYGEDGIDLAKQRLQLLARPRVPDFYFSIVVAWKERSGS